MAGLKITLKRVFVKGYLAFELPAEPEAREALRAFLVSCQKQTNDYISVSLTKPFKPRTTGPNSQNHKLNGMIMQLCNYTGNDYDSVKYCIKMLAVEQLGYPFKELGGRLLPKGEHECSTEECSLLIEAAYLLGAELGFVFREG